MPRKKAKTAEATPAEITAIEQPATATLEPTPAPQMMDAPQEATEQETPKNWGPQYRAVYVSAKGFELGEDRRFKQRVFKFKAKPDDDVIATLKENGFTYRPKEHSWTVPANAETRLITDRMAREFDGNAQSVGRG